MLSFRLFLQLLKESFRDLLPIVLVILFFQLAVLQTIPPQWISTSIGLLIVAIGLALFLMGLATNIEGRDPLIDGFGLIAFASLFPMITVMLYGIVSGRA